jgi:hypothetical protein
MNVLRRMDGPSKMVSVDLQATLGGATPARRHLNHDLISKHSSKLQIGARLRVYVLQQLILGRFL